MDKLIGLKRIKENDQKDILIICESLIEIIKTIIDNPSDLTKRKINLDKLEVLMTLTGGMETLFEIGFIEDDDSLILPTDVSSEFLKDFITELNRLKSEPDEANKPQAAACQSTIIPTQTKQLPQVQNLRLNPMINNNKFALKLQNTHDHVLFYEDENLKQKALNLVPMHRLTKDATIKFNSYIEQTKKSLANETKLYDLRDFILLELMAWFKNEFFSWVNEPNCTLCHTNKNMKFKRQSRPESYETLWLAGNVEVYECSACLKETRFPRYNHPEKLLETRKGRCGEWANGFCLILRSAGFDSRYVLDWTDHVWCEVYSESQSRWLHADPCENTLDKPLLYEHGWNKKLSYIIAFSSYECIDVTWRYTTQFSEILKRRNECDEIWLVNFVNKLSQNRQINFDKTRKDKIQRRLVTEIVEFLTPKTVKDGEDVGRQSGSLQWRVNRGEIETPLVSNDYKFKLELSYLKENNSFQILYNAAKDVYSSPNGSLKGWKNAVYKFNNIQYKVENDWNMCYLARTTGSLTGYVEWFFDLSELKSSDKKLLKINLQLEGSCFENGCIDWSIFWSDSNDLDNNELKLNGDVSNQQNVPFKINKQNNNYELNSFVNSKLSLFKIRADLSLGTGDNAWQHTQLFRQSLNDQNRNSFDVCFYFDN